MDPNRSRRAPLSVRGLLLASVALTAVGTSLWRTQIGHHFLPGLFTVVSVPLSVALFVMLDWRVRFPLGGWVAAALLLIAHLVFSVPALPGPIYYLGSRVVRIDHFVHVFSGGLVAWLCWGALRQRRQPPTMPPQSIAVVAVVVALGFGAAKEVTDYLSVKASGLPHDALDTTIDFTANALGATIAVLWRAIRDRGGIDESALPTSVPDTAPAEVDSAVHLLQD